MEEKGKPEILLDLNKSGKRPQGMTGKVVLLRIRNFVIDFFNLALLAVRFVLLTIPLYIISRIVGEENGYVRQKNKKYESTEKSTETMK